MLIYMKQMKSNENSSSFLYVHSHCDPNPISSHMKDDASLDVVKIPTNLGLLGIIDGIIHCFSAVLENISFLLSNTNPI